MTTKTATRKATIDTLEFYEALQKVKAVKPNRQFPVLENTLVEFAGGKAILTSTDMTRTIKTALNSTNTETFSVLLPRRLSAKFFSGANGKTTLTQGNSPRLINLAREGIGSINLTTPPVSDFPPLPQQLDNLEWHTIDGKWLCSMLRIVATACAEEDVRPVLTGVAFNDRAIAAADGFRLAVLKDRRLEFGLGDKHTIVPFNTVALLVKLFSKEKAVKIAFETTKEPIRHVHIKSDSTALTSELIQGTYPNYQQLIPGSFACKASFSAPLLLQRLNMIDPIAIPAGIVRYVFQTLETNEQVCSISATIEDQDKYSLSCPVRFQGDEAKIAFNHRYMVEALKPFAMCDLEITSPSSPGKLTGDIDGLTIMIMPMFVQW